MWFKDWRDKVWGQLDRPWDILVIGGGITGTGILREATRLGLKTLLVERHDFAWGTSGRSSKLVHGGLRYLAEAKLRLTYASVRERNRLLSEAPGLIEPLGFALATYKDEFPGRWSYEFALTLYDMFNFRWSHSFHNADEFRQFAPHIAPEGLRGGFHYTDAQTDDTRLVLRIIRESVTDGGLALNYARVHKLLHKDHRVVGVQLHDEVQNRTSRVYAKVVVNATGAWVDFLRDQIGAKKRIRPLRGSHLILPDSRLPLAQGVNFLHPIDQRPVFVYPWEGISLVGTTDTDHNLPMGEEPFISPSEFAYLMAGLDARFPSLDLEPNDVICTFAGIRPVIGTGKADPSKESREHVVWDENGLVTVTGGKLTTFRLIALDALRAVRDEFEDIPFPDDDAATFKTVETALPPSAPVDEPIRRRLLGRYGSDANDLIDLAEPDELELISGTPILWAELRWAARAEGVVHLQDLLFRRVRLGLLLPKGGIEHLPGIRKICQSELGWDDRKWEKEEDAYCEHWRKFYSVPDPKTIPDWRRMVADAKAKRSA